MKKLLIMTGVAAFAFGAFAFSNGSGFDELTAGEAFKPSEDDSYWGALTTDLEATVTSYSESGETAYATRPAYFVDNNVSQSNFLAIESASTSNPLVRYINESSTTGKDIGNGLYLDTLVKFTASTETMGTSDTAAKLAIWAQTSDETPAVTNFVVQAGYVTANDTANNVISTNYVMTAPANFDFTAWHRLTVKAISDIGGDHAGFVVFVDGTALEREDGAAIADEGALTLNTVAGKFANAVLPSRRSSNWDDYQTLQAVSFSGNGKIDDVSFTDVAPQFAADATVYTVTWGEGIASVSYNNTALVKGAENTLPEGSFDLVVTLESGYELGEPTASTDGCTVELKEGADNTYTVTGAQAGTAITFTAFQPKASVVVDGKTINYNTLKEAFDAIKSTGGTITLKADMTVGGEDVIVPEGSAITVTIDLAGKKVTGSKEANVFTAAGGTLIIEDSVGGGEVVADDDGVAIYFAGGNVTINGGKFTGSFDLDDPVQMVLSNYLTLTGGSYDAATWTYKALDEVTEATITGPTEDGYYTVGGEEPVVETAIAVPTAEPDLTYNGAEQTGVAAGTGYTLTGNTGTNAGEYTATATLEKGYVWTDESKEPKSITWTIAKKTVTATITLAPASATYDAEKKTVDDYTDATVTFGDDTLANTDYTVTGLDTAVAEAGEFTITVAPAASDSNYTFDTVTAKLTVTAVQPPEPEIEPVDPANGGTAEFKNADAAIAAADAINEDKAKYIAAPEGIANTYYDNVEAKADGTTVSVVFTTDGEAAAQTSANAEVDELDKVLSAAAVDATAATITGAVPGFFYSVVYGTSLTGESAFADEGARAQADKDGNVTIPVPTAGKGAGFYKVKVSPTK